MQEIGQMNRFFQEDSLRRIDYTERPEALPPLGLNDRIYAGVDMGEGQVVQLLESGQSALSEAQQLWDYWKAGNCKSVTFYLG